MKLKICKNCKHQKEETEFFWKRHERRICRDCIKKAIKLKKRKLNYYK